MWTGPPPTVAFGLTAARGRSHSMKVFHIIDSLGGSGGAEQGIVREITRFSSDLDQHVIRLFPADALAPIVTAAGIEDRWLGLKDHSATRAYPGGIRRLLRIVRDERPDVIHTSLFAANVVGQVVGRITRTPVLSTFTLSGDPRLLRAHQPGGATRKAEILRSIGARVARSKHVSFRALTADAAETNARLLGIGLDRVTVIPRGVPSDLRPDPLRTRAELGLPEDRRLIVNVGREVAQKGQVHLMRVFARLLEEHPDLHLVICGRTGETTAELSAMTADMGLEDRVTRMGYTEHVHDVVGHATIFGFPSLMEGLGTALLEAMAIGTAIVAFEIPPVVEAVGADGAVLVPLLDEDRFHKECNRLLSDEEARTAQVEAGRRRVLEHYSIETVAARVEALIRSTATA